MHSKLYISIFMFCNCVLGFCFSSAPWKADHSVLPLQLDVSSQYGVTVLLYMEHCTAIDPELSEAFVKFDCWWCNWFSPCPLF